MFPFSFFDLTRATAFVKLLNLLCVTWGSRARLIQGKMEGNSEYCDAGSF